MPFNGAALKQWREERGLTQFGLAKLTAVTLPNGEIDMVRPDYLSIYENGRRNPDIDHFMRLQLATQLPHAALWIDEHAAVRSNAV